MNFSCTRILHTSSFRFEAGHSTFSCRARTAVRMRVSRSAIGSVMDDIPDLSLPARLGDARDHPPVRHLAQADPAEAELAEIAPRPPADVAALVGAHGELRLVLGF